jgi:adenine-specific DNA-methyltransferase
MAHELVQENQESRNKLKSLLRGLFQLDTSSDLDFGIYRIMNYKKEDIEEFIEKDLIEEIEKQFKQFKICNGETSSPKNIEENKMAGKINKNYHDLYLFRDNEAQGELESSNQIQHQIIDVYNLIYDFFSRYFDKGDFLSRRRYSRKYPYIIPYFGEEVLLHWANHDQYYIKTDEFFKNYSFNVGDSRVSFKIKEAEIESNNSKGEKRYFIPANGHAIEAQKSNVLIWFQYRTLSEEEKKKYGTSNIQDEFIQEIIKKIDAKNNGWKDILLKSNGDGSSLLEKHLKRYVNKNTCDFFIHKNLREFLKSEFEFFIKNEVLDLDEMDAIDEKHLKMIMFKAKAIHGICHKIIEFLAQIEDFQKTLFEKKKFVMRTDYCMTLDNVPLELYPEILKNKDQLNVWKTLYGIGEEKQSTITSSFGSKSIYEADIKEHPFLVLDTKFFDQGFKDKLLASFDDLEEATGGLMIKSENWQALNLMQEKYMEKVKCIYIDPPYNTGKDEFIYKDSYQSSSWLSMMGDRIENGKNLLKDTGIFFSSIDDNEETRLKSLLDDILREENFISKFIWKKRTGSNDAKKFYVSVDHEYIIAYAKTAQFTFRGITKDFSNYANSDNDPRGPWARDNLTCNKTREERPNLFYPITDIDTGIVYQCNPNRVWAYEKERMIRIIKEKKVLFPKNGKGTPMYKRHLSEVRSDRKPLSTWIITTSDVNNNEDEIANLKFPINSQATKELLQLFGKQVFDHPKSVQLVKGLAEQTIELNDTILDFFAGSGTTAHAVLNLNIEDKGHRKYILIEIGNYFDSVIKPRIQKVMYSKDWKDGKPQSKDGISHIFKYQYLEQYEDTLNNIIFSDLSKTSQETLDGFDDYFLKYMLEYETRESPARLAVKQFENPFDYKLKITSGGEERIETVDLVETFNYLIGLKVERIRVFENNNRKYRVVFGKKEDNKIVVVWRSIEGINYEKDNDFVENTILKNEKFNTIYINGKDSLIPGAEPIEPEFKRLMGA